MISQTVDYALRAVACLAAADGSMTTDAVAEKTRVPRAYLAKIMRSLARAEIVRSVRGVNGGSVLARDPAGLSLLEVVNAVDPVRRIERCPLDLPRHGVRLCPLHRRLDDAIAEFERAFGETMLAELLDQAEGSVPLCDIRRLGRD
ncbi:MAG: Rrf2 family transcriptional regulator [Planctomycetota bacterium]